VLFSPLSLGQFVESGARRVDARSTSARCAFEPPDSLEFSNSLSFKRPSKTSFDFAFPFADYDFSFADLIRGTPSFEFDFSFADSKFPFANFEVPDIPVDFQFLDPDIPVDFKFSDSKVTHSVIINKLSSLTIAGCA
jgi:hypothetical protein